MRKREDLTGKKFGRLLVIGTELDEKGKSLQVCQCDCGNMVKLHTYRLKDGTTVSCGCHSRDKARERMSIEGEKIARRYQMSKPLPVQTGDVFGMLTVIRESGLVPDSKNGRNRRSVLCKCDCGKELEVWVKHLLNGHRVSCGCLKARGTKLSHGQSANRAHGIQSTGEYNSWLRCLERCYNPINKAYLDYGLIGIRVCDRWREKFENFYADMGEKPSPEYSLDRIDNQGPYSPNNCRWATKSEQAANRTYLTYEEKTERVKKSAIHLAQQYMIRSKYEEKSIASKLSQIVELLA